jgi:hypothetical protein
MTPLEIIAAAAARLVQEADGCRDRGLSVRLKENAATIRGGVASIRNALTAPDDRPRKRLPPDRLIVGDEGGP